MKQKEKVQALILSRRNIGEADRLVTLFTREFGLMRVIANGVRKIPSKRGGHLEPFTNILAVISTHKNKSYLSSVEAVDLYIPLHKNEDAMLSARNLALIIKGLFEECDPQPAIFEAVREAWQIMPELTYAKQAALEAAVSIYILRCGGIMPDLSMCRLCGVEKPTEAIVLDPQEGTWNCLLCHSGFQGTDMSLPPHLLKVLRFLHVYPRKALRLDLNQNDSSQLTASLRSYISYVIQQPVLKKQW